MPKYQIYFDTVQGETKYNVDIDEPEVLDDVLHEILRSEERRVGKECA